MDGNYFKPRDNVPVHSNCSVTSILMGKFVFLSIQPLTDTLFKTTVSLSNGLLYTKNFDRNFYLWHFSYQNFTFPLLFLRLLVGLPIITIFFLLSVSLNSSFYQIQAQTNVQLSSVQNLTRYRKPVSTLGTSDSDFPQF